METVIIGQLRGEVPHISENPAVSEFMYVMLLPILLQLLRTNVVGTFSG
jgi:hypothetical protein